MEVEKLEEKIKAFLDAYQTMTDLEKKELIKHNGESFLEIVGLYAEIHNLPEIKDQIIALQKENKQTEEKENRILLLKRDIEDILSKQPEEEIVYDFTEEEKEILTSYFEKTKDGVIEKILEGIRDRILGRETHRRRRKDRFQFKTPFVIFPDGYHSEQELMYLEELCRNRVKELGLGTIGIMDLKIVPSQTYISLDSYKIAYSCERRFGLKNKYSIYQYSLETTCDIEKARQLIRQKRN